MLEKICRKEGLKPTKIQPLKGGQVNQVYSIDDEFVLRIGSREDAFQRLIGEAELIQGLPREIPVPEIYAYGEMDGIIYQIQKFMPGEKLYRVWRDLLPGVQENIAAELATYLKILHGRTAQHFGYICAETPSYDSWSDYLEDRFKHTLEEIDAYRFQMVQDYVELARVYFEEGKHVLQDAVPVCVHGDLSFVNILVHSGRISALLDFEYAMQAPKDYELCVIENFCLYPNDYVEEDDEYFCTGDYASFLQLLRKHDPDLFDIPNLRERMNLYHLEATLGSHLAWRKANLSTIPVDKMAAKEFYMARITNFIFRHGTRLF